MRHGSEQERHLRFPNLLTNLLGDEKAAERKIDGGGWRLGLERAVEARVLRVRAKIGLLEDAARAIY
jgi:hypothetical protein